jgi:hypothetical protein
MTLLALMPNPKKNMVYGAPMPELTINFTLYPLQHMFHLHGQLYARVDLNPLNPIPKSALSPSQKLRIWPQQCRITITTLH